MQGGFGIQVGALLRRLPIAASVAPVIEKEDVQAEFVMDEEQVLQAMADVATVAMTPEKRQVAPARHEPAVKRDAIAGYEVNLLIGEAYRSRIGE